MKIFPKVLGGGLLFLEHPVYMCTKHLADMLIEHRDSIVLEFSPGICFEIVLISGKHKIYYIRILVSIWYDHFHRAKSKFYVSISASLDCQEA